MSDDDIVCTAEVNAGEDRPNILFTPPCACPRCRPDPIEETAQNNTFWQRIDGRTIRHDVRLVELGQESALRL